MLYPASFLRPALEIPLCHHERWDGTGYPNGLGGEHIPVSARIFAIVDVWDALRSDRPYRPAWSADRALKHIGDQAGSHFDPEIVNVFLQMITGAQ
jgi:HD-GYP domain-containing protein (c-di-GMP phosphodiesterase class II)